VTGDRLPLIICRLLDLQRVHVSCPATTPRLEQQPTKRRRAFEATAAEESRCSTIFYYSALTVAALYEHASAYEHQGGRILTAHREEINKKNKSNCESVPKTIHDFRDKHPLVLALISRVEGTRLTRDAIIRADIHRARARLPAKRSAGL